MNMNVFIDIIVYPVMALAISAFIFFIINRGKMDSDLFDDCIIPCTTFLYGVLLIIAPFNNVVALMMV